MTKKDRISLVLSVLALFPGTTILDLLGFKFSMSLTIVLALLMAYWGFRFVQDDISFINTDNPQNDE